MPISNLIKKLSISLIGATVLGLGTSNAAQATSFFVSTNDGKVGTVDQATGVFTQIASGPVFTDIALSNSEEIFGVTFSQLYKVNQTTSTSSLIGNLGVSNMNGLGFTTSNTLYGTGGSRFYSVNTSTGAASLVSNISGFSSSGDIVYDPVNNRFLATSAGDSLWSIGLNGIANKIGDIGFGDVYGLAFDDDGTLYGYTANRQQIVINPTTGSGTFNQNVTGISSQIFGSASLPSTGPSTSVPEPASVLGLFAFGAIGAGSLLKRKQQQQATVKA
ncbi:MULTISPECIES: PEP-CTERM sorting domain-containing protein [unclassified Anabaena]|uniref:PEP-CTERM sorting domain-containing protein n=1 Tax=unclassified Anabaena TaxID=2619674 RepID=UPI001447F60C|nr:MULTISPECIES: PEP-CTERM sorting domain-containing protein [unclassified Anabaena]MTJ08830.1 PEP-CTERM sorting domain-containing protein [Anabaena sp. UHCC 0204]MTJ53130.1 PEP-CTERM sorting domain-containing protein [Anabaena sp. UHCC 0253]